MAPGIQTDQLAQARRTFFEWGGAPVGQVPATILKSWSRCRNAGLEAVRDPGIEPVDAMRLREMRQRHEILWRLARAEIELLSSDADANGSMVILTDADGWILDAGGDTGFLDKAGRVALMPGACWHESRVGTNAIGTAIHEQRHVEVHGGEHYLPPHRILSCSAAPIFDPHGHLVGVLDISGESSMPQRHAMGLVRLAIANIEHRYFDEGIADAELLRVHRDPALLGSSREGLLAFRNGRLVAANQVGLGLFGLARGELGRASFDALFDEPLSRLRSDGAFHDRHGRAFYGRVDSAGRQRRATMRTPITVSPATRHARDDAPIFDAALDAGLQRSVRVLDAGIPVLVQGETGCGKEVFARELHRRCARAGKPFVAVNCAALPEGLIEAELFGYEDGAFTGARKAGNPGLLRQADGGVLFLDEIGDMPLALQPRLLRVLQDRELSPLGGGKPVKLDFALVCATHRALDAAIDDGRFRADLYYRLAHHVVELPPLRAHADRVGLVDELWQRLGEGRRLTDDTRAALADYDWPGNLRQLVACLRTVVALSEPGATVTTDGLPAYLRRVPAGEAPTAARNVSPSTDLQALNRQAMRAAIEACNGNVVHAARRLGISRSTLYRQLGRDLRDGR
ncbi:sigma-54-dependent Fis family transcriptional regulator [Luteimonas sp. XNQY3]|nr:sigma-54-dependent Fis family transcriptional regulator [Luteimonas sp. XNQY3]MCD9004883.1 sigma-54-dependent Fis family transcriptional regulator [Luteimonas sp. XNQY3]